MPLAPGDIALLAPTSRELWRYERALEAKGLPIASQAGKGLFRRQEVQDLLALTRVLADGGDKPRASSKPPTNSNKPWIPGFKVNRA
jgi:CRISPR-associated exonuclease Cas4